MWIRTIGLAAILTANAWAVGQDNAAGPAEKPLAKQGYVGLALRDIPSGDTVVSWLFPGPLGGKGLTASAVDLARPDVIAAVNGERMNADEFKELIRNSPPGTGVRIEYRRANRRGGGIPDALDHEDEVHTIEVTLESREEWTGTIHRRRGHDDAVAFTDSPLLDPHDAENLLASAIEEHELGKPIGTLLGVFMKWQEQSDDFHSLSRVRAGFNNPFCLPELGRLVTASTRQAPADPVGLAVRLAMDNLDAHQLVTSDHDGMTESREAQTGARDWLFRRLRHATTSARNSLGDIYGDRGLAERALSLLRVPRRTFYLAGPDTKSHVAVIRRSMAVDFHQLISALRMQGEIPPLTPEQLGDSAPTTLPAELEDAVEGAVLAAAFMEDVGWVVIGSEEANRYDMARIAGVADPDGDDEYYASDLMLGCRVIVDRAGDDLYTGTPDQGPGSALLGVSFIDDRAGNDRYEGELLSAGAAVFGTSLLLDRGGNDIYKGSEWSLGAAMYGAGMIVDLGGGNDQYLGDFLCEGVGGPRGFGCIIDENGRDLYRANGPTPSAYGTSAVYQAFSQGIGFGYRNYAAGGVGLISDLGGDDRYEAGEFAQGGAYYFGLGILHDASGRDLYYGNRYGQGFGVHQAMGILADDAGDDTYWAMTAACQGAAWDIGAGLLIDRAGNDTYQCDGLGQGGASMQGIAMLVDLAGRDRYVAGGGATQGQSGGNGYHYHETNALSLSLLIDLGGEDDHYSRGRPNNATTTTGRFNEKTPKNSPLYGIVIDR